MAQRGRPRKLENIFKPSNQKRSFANSKNQQGAGFDNPRENIDPHIKTKTITTQQGLLNIVPIGVILAWHRNMTGVPSLPDNWLECDGQTINDTASPMNGEDVPDLNDILTGRHIRGGSNSGVVGGSITHTHTFLGTEVESTTATGQGSNNVSAGSNIQAQHTHKVTAEGENQPGISDPRYMSMIWIIRIK